MRAGLVDIAHGISHTEARTGRGAQAATWLRWPIGLFLLVHGVVHLMGAVLLLELGEPGELTYAVARPEAGSVLAVLFAGLWSVAMALFIVAGLQVLRGRGWSAWLIAASACSIVAIAPMMSAAPVGMIVSLVALLTGSGPRGAPGSHRWRTSGPHTCRSRRATRGSNWLTRPV